MMWWGGGHWYWGVVMMIMLWGRIVAIAYFVLHGRANDARRPLALEILDERFAKGELSSEEYERSRATLDGRPLGRSEAVRR